MPKYVGPRKGVLSNIRRRLGYRPTSLLSKNKIAGSQGLALGDVQAMEEEFLQGERPSTEQVQEYQGHELGTEEATAFVNGEKEIHVRSSNVVSAQYYPESQQMFIAFKTGQYIYDNVSIQDAISFVQALSKGSEIWNTYRVRGSRTATRKPYKKISG